MAEGSKANKGRVCVTGATGFLGSWMVKRLLEDGYSVNATVRNINPECTRDLTFLTTLPGASERLNIFNADLDNPDSFMLAFQGCIGVFHMAHPLDFSDTESEETKTKRVTSAMHAILKACVDSKTVRRVVYTSSITAASLSTSKDSIDESCWTDADFVRSFNIYAGSYVVTKVLAEKAAWEFAEKHCELDLVTVLPAIVTGPFICPNVPDTVTITLALVLGHEVNYKYLKSTTIVHVDDVARCHIHLFEHPEAKGRYICSGFQTSIQGLSEFLSGKYPEYEMPNPDCSSLKDVSPLNFSGILSTKLLETGFEYEKGVEEMFDGAITCCKEKGVL